MTEDQLEKAVAIKKKLRQLREIQKKTKRDTSIGSIEPEVMRKVEILFGPGTFYFHVDNSLYEDLDELIENIQRVSSVYLEVLLAMIKKEIEKLEKEFENL